MMVVSITAYFAKKKPSTIQEICSHQQLQRNLWGNGKFWNLGTAVGVSYFVHEVRAYFGQHMGTIVNNRELQVCPCQLNNTKVCHLTKVVEMERLVLTVLAICSEYVQNAQQGIICTFLEGLRPK